MRNLKTSGVHVQFFLYFSNYQESELKQNQKLPDKTRSHGLGASTQRHVLLSPSLSLSPFARRSPAHALSVGFGGFIPAGQILSGFGGKQRTPTRPHKSSARALPQIWIRDFLGADSSFFALTRDFVVVVVAANEVCNVF